MMVVGSNVGGDGGGDDVLSYHVPALPLQSLCRDGGVYLANVDR